jgi:hypothetical protein
MEITTLAHTIRALRTERIRMRGHTIIVKALGAHDGKTLISRRNPFNVPQTFSNSIIYLRISNI